MHHIVEHVAAQLLLELLLVVEVKLDEMDALVLQVLLRAAATYGGPGVHTPPQGLFYDKRADESAGSCDKNLHKY